MEWLNNDHVDDDDACIDNEFLGKNGFGRHPEFTCKTLCIGFFQFAMADKNKDGGHYHDKGGRHRKRPGRACGRKTRYPVGHDENEKAEGQQNIDEEIFSRPQFSGGFHDRSLLLALDPGLDPGSKLLLALGLGNPQLFRGNLGGTRIVEQPGADRLPLL